MTTDLVRFFYVMGNKAKAPLFEADSRWTHSTTGVSSDVPSHAILPPGSTNQSLASGHRTECDLTHRG
jgi:hypothetical protein